jgi:hypothetical protein
MENLVYDWIRFFYCGYFPDHIAVNVVDNFILDGWPAIYRITLSLLRLYEDEIMFCTNLLEVSELFETLKSGEDPKLASLFEVAVNEVLDLDLELFELNYFIRQVQFKTSLNYPK